MREYEKTHPWINFQLDLRKLDYTIWMALGEAQSKCIHIAGVPLKPAIAQELNTLYLAKGVVATTAIEGNTLTEKEVRAQLKEELRLPPSKEYLARETKNIIDLFNEINKSILDKKGSDQLSVEKIARYNRQILNEIPVDEAVKPGMIRDYSTVVGTYRCPGYQDCEYLINKLCEWLNTSFEAPRGMEIAFGLLKAIMAHLYFVWIHPFGDGNGRTARLIEFEILRRAGVPSPAAHLLSNYYNQTRSLYYINLNQASKKPEIGVIEFIEYAIKGFIEGLKEQLMQIRLFQWEVSWVNYIHERFSGKNSKSDRRKLDLILAISGIEQDLIPIKELGNLSSKIAGLYATKTTRIFYRDLNDLEEMDLIKIDINKDKVRCVRIRNEIILAFLPINIDEPLFDELIK